MDLCPPHSAKLSKPSTCGRAAACLVEFPVFPGEELRQMGDIGGTGLTRPELDGPQPSVMSRKALKARVQENHQFQT